MTSTNSQLYNIARPFSITNTGGAFSSDTSIDAVVKQNLKNLLTTQKGERVIRRDLGCNLWRLVFEQKTEQLKISIAEEIAKAVSIWMSFVQLDSVNIFFSDDEAKASKILNVPTIKDNNVFVAVTYHFLILGKTYKDTLELYFETYEGT